MKIYIKFTSFYLLCFLISACSSISNAPTTVQQTYNDMDYAIGRINTSAQKCIDDVTKESPAYESVFETNGNEFTERALSSKKYIQKTQKKSLQETFDKISACRNNKISQIQNSSNEFVRSFTYIVMDEKALKDDVYKNYINGKITGGQAATSIDNIGKALQAKSDYQYQIGLNALNRQHFQQLQSEAAMWQAMGSTFQNYNQQQQAYQNTYNQHQQIKMPVHTSCQWNGGILNCTSY